MISRTLILAATASLLVGCAATDNAPAPVTADAGSNRDCFFLSQVSGYSPAGRDMIRVSAGPGREYEFKTFGACPDIDYSNAIGFDQKGPGTICQGMDVDLIVPSSIGPRRCPVSMIRRIPPPPQP